MLEVNYNNIFIWTLRHPHSQSSRKQPHTMYVTLCVTKNRVTAPFFGQIFILSSGKYGITIFHCSLHDYLVNKLLTLVFLNKCKHNLFCLKCVCVAVVLPELKCYEGYSRATQTSGCSRHICYCYGDNIWPHQAKYSLPICQHITKVQLWQSFIISSTWMLHCGSNK